MKQTRLNKSSFLLTLAVALSLVICVTPKVDDSEVTGPNAFVSVESLNEVPGTLRGVTHVFVKEVIAD